MDIEVIKWLYEFGIRHDYNDICHKIEMHLKASSKQPSLSSSGLLPHLRVLQTLVHKRESITQADLETLIGVLEDFLQYKPFHINSLQRVILNLYISAKLQVVNQSGLKRSALLEHLPYFNWTHLKDKFGFEHDHLRKEWEKLVLSAHDVIQANTQTSSEDGTSNLSSDRLEVIKTQFRKNLEVVVMQFKQLLLTSTTLKKITDSDLVQASTVRLAVDEYKILLSALRRSVTGAAFSKVLAVVLLRATHCLPSDEDRVMEEGIAPVNNMQTVQMPVNNSGEGTSRTEFTSTLGEFCINGRTIVSSFDPKYAQNETVRRVIDQPKKIQFSWRILKDQEIIPVVHELNDYRDKIIGESNVRRHFSVSREENSSTKSVSSGNDNEDRMISQLNKQIEDLESYATLLRDKVEQLEMKLGGGERCRREELGDGGRGRHQPGSPI